tara:strand:+ start:804 stop:1475 length:672 start_codon:yes stop_codon:yes gene_type:complete
MKGIIILTADERAYKQGHVIETGGFVHAPTNKDITYIVHLRRITEKEIKRWIDVVGYRLVIVIEKLPSLSEATKEAVIIDKSLQVGKPNHKRQIDALLRWSDRGRVHRAFQGMPIPLALSFLRENKKDDMRLWRMLADVAFTLPNEYAEAVMVYGIKPSRTAVKWPKKKAKGDERPTMFRKSDKYWRKIIEADVEVRNDLRSENIDSLPTVMKRRKEKVSQWL